MVSLKKIMVLSWADMVGGFVLRVMMPYLTETRKLSLADAGNIMNLFEGLVAIIPLAMCFLVDVFVGDYIMLLVTGLAYSFGMFFLTTTTPGSLFSGNTQIVLFYIALALILIGRSGYKTSIRPFYGQQLHIVGMETSDDQLLSTVSGIFGDLCCVAVIGVIGLIILFYIKPWSIRFGVSAGFTVFACLLFISGSCSYYDYYPITPEGRQSNRVGTAMQYVEMMPVLITFVVGGVVTSISSSYFIEQANHLNNKLWIVKLITLPMLPAYYDGIKSLFTNKLRWCPAEVRVVIALLLSVIGCITAALVEVKRLGVVRSHGLIDKPEEQIPMSIFWLIPQFLLIAAFDGVLETSSEEYLEANLPGSKKRRMPIFSDGVVGVGTMFGAGLVQMLTKVSERGGKPSWFQETLNESRLDNYYWTLAALSAVTLVLYVLYLMLRIWFSSMGMCEPPFEYEIIEE